MLVKDGEKNVAVIYHHQQFYALDNACYHHGGSLLMGDIEDIGGHRCLVCPWHRYYIALNTGDGLYKGVDIDPVSQLPKPVISVKSKGCKQRVHRVVVEGDDVLVVLNRDSQPIESDTYAMMPIANQEQPTAEPIVVTAAHSPPSGSVLLHSRRL